MLYVHVCVPPPHDALHEPQLVKLPTQSTAHCCGLQPLCDSVAPSPYGHAVPSHAGVLMLYVRVWVPPPHDALHPPQPPQAPTQFVCVQHCVLQSCVMVWPWEYGHAAPPSDAGVMMPYVHVCVPPSHDALHVSQLQLPTQSHDCVLQLCDSL